MGNIFLGKIATVAQVLSCPSLGSFPSHCMSSEGLWSEVQPCILDSLREREGGRWEVWECVIGYSCSGLFPLTIFQEE